MHVEFTCFGWLTLYFWPLWGNGKIVNPSTTCPGVSLTFELWSFNSSSWKLCKCTSNSRFLSDWPFISDHCGKTVELPTLPRPVPGHRRRFSEVSTLHLEICANARQIHVFRVINLYFWPLWGNGRIVNPSTTCPVVSSTFLWSFIFVSWKLCECTLNSRVLGD